MNNAEKETDNKKEKLNQIIELKSMNAVNKEEDINSLLLTENVPQIDLNLGPKNKYELFKKYFPIIITILSFLLSYNLMDKLHHNLLNPFLLLDTFLHWSQTYHI